MTSEAEAVPAGVDPKLKNPRHATGEELAWERKYMRIAGGSGSVAGVLLLISFFLKASAVEDLAPKKHAENVVRDHFSTGKQLVLYLFNVVWGAGLALTSLVAMRTGLLSRFLGVLGLIVGVLYAVPLLGGGGGLLQFVWYVAVGMVISNVWPGGRGPAWAAGARVRW